MLVIAWSSPRFVSSKDNTETPSLVGRRVVAVGQFLGVHKCSVQFGLALESGFQNGCDEVGYGMMLLS